MNIENTVTKQVLKILLVAATAIAITSLVERNIYRIRAENLESQVKYCRQLSVEQIDANKDGRLDIQVRNGLFEIQTFFDVDGKYMTIDQITEQYGLEGAKQYKKK